MSTDWRALVDTRHDAERSLVLRYRPVLARVGLEPALDEDELVAVSLGEGARMVPLGEHDGVQLLVCDESSLMVSGTYKDLDACVTVAQLRAQGIDRVVTSSGGNLGRALARYCRAQQIELVGFQPKTTRHKLDSDTLGSAGVHLVSTDLPEPQIKALARRFAEHAGLRHVPDLSWRLAASACRAMFLLEAQLCGPRPAGWIAQAVCAGYGPIGMYDCWSRLLAEGRMPSVRPPRLLAVQQLANAPMVRAWAEGEFRLHDRHRGDGRDLAIEPGLYNTNPRSTYSRLAAHLRRFGGTLMGVGIAEYERHVERLLGWLEGVGIELTRGADGREILERAGLLAGVGLLVAIERGVIEPGDHAVFMLTGGVRPPSVPVASSVPVIEIDGSRPLDGWVEVLQRQLA